LIEELKTFLSEFIQHLIDDQWSLTMPISMERGGDRDTATDNHPFVSISSYSTVTVSPNP
jgi:hypothetical protein